MRSRVIKSIVLTVTGVAFFVGTVLGTTPSAHAQTVINTAAALDAAQSRLQALESKGAECRIRLWAIEGADANFFENQQTFDALKERYAPFSSLLNRAGDEHGVNMVQLLKNINLSMALVGRTENESVSLLNYTKSFESGLNDLGYTEEFFENLASLIKAYNTFAAGDDINPADVLQSQVDAFNALRKEVSSWSKIAGLGEASRNIQSHVSSLISQTQLILDEPPIVRGYTSIAEDIVGANDSLRELNKLNSFEDSAFKQFILDGANKLSEGTIPKLDNPLFLDNLELLQNSGALVLEAVSHFEAAVNTCLDVTRTGALQTGYKQTARPGEYEIYASVPSYGVCEWDLTATDPSGSTQSITNDQCRFTQSLAQGTQVQGSARALGSFYDDAVAFLVNNVESSCFIRDIEPGEDGEKQVHATVDPCWYENNTISVDPTDLPQLDENLIDKLEICADTEVDLDIIKANFGPACMPLRDLLKLLNINLNPGSEDKDEDNQSPPAPPSTSTSTTTIPGENPDKEQNECDVEGAACSPVSTCRRVEGNVLKCVQNQTQPPPPSHQCSQVGVQAECAAGQLCTALTNGTRICTNQAAQLPDCPAGSICFNPPSQFETFTDLLNEIINWAIRIGSVVAVMMVIYSGVLYMTAAGNSIKVAHASKVLAFVAVGVFVLILSKSLIVIVRSIFGV